VSDDGASDVATVDDRGHVALVGQRYGLSVGAVGRFVRDVGDGLCEVRSVIGWSLAGFSHKHHDLLGLASLVVAADHDVRPGVL
jgi:hypothetical protein